MLTLAEYFVRFRDAQWRRKFGTEFSGFHEGRPISFQWREVTVGHVCVGGDPMLHLKCHRLVQTKWCFVRGKAAEPAP